MGRFGPARRRRPAAASRSATPTSSRRSSTTSSTCSTSTAGCCSTCRSRSASSCCAASCASTPRSATGSHIEDGRQGRSTRPSRKQGLEGIDRQAAHQPLRAGPALEVLAQDQDPARAGGSSSSATSRARARTRDLGSLILAVHEGKELRYAGRGRQRHRHRTMRASSRPSSTSTVSTSRRWSTRRASRAPCGPSRASSSASSSASGPTTACCARPRSRASRSARTRGRSSASGRSRRATATRRGGARRRSRQTRAEVGAAEGELEHARDRPSDCCEDPDDRGRPAAGGHAATSWPPSKRWRKEGAWEVGGHDVNLTNLDKVLFPEPGLHQARPDPLLRDDRAGAAAVPARPAAQPRPLAGRRHRPHLLAEADPALRARLGRALGLPGGGLDRVAHLRRRRPRGDDGLAGQPGDHRPASVDVDAPTTTATRPTR